MARGQIHHIEIYVSDLKRTVSFWEWFLKDLGYEVYQKWESVISFKLDDAYLVFVQTEEKYLDVPYHRCRVGLNHLAFHADSREEVDEMTDKLKAKGMYILYPDRHPYAGGENYYAVFFEDPDRVKVEFVAPELI